MKGLRAAFWTAGVAACLGGVVFGVVRGQPGPYPVQPVPVQPAPAPGPAPFLTPNPAPNLTLPPTGPAPVQPVITPVVIPQAAPDPGPAFQAAPVGSLPATAMPVEGGGPETVLANDPILGRQEPAASIEWIGPPSAKVGEAVTYQLIVRNLTSNRLHGVSVRAEPPRGVTVQATEPKAENASGTLAWDLGTLEPRQERRMDVQMLPEGTGIAQCRAAVTFTGVTVARFQILQPRLILKAQAPPKVVVEDPATIMVTASNPGNAVTERVKLKVTLTEGLEHARGRVFEMDLGNLGPNESRSTYVLCAGKVPGVQRCDLEATAQAGLSAAESVSLEVLSPKVELSMNGPGMRYLDRQATLNFKVANNGTAPASQITLVNEVPPGFKVRAASHGGRHDFVARTVIWAIGDLPPGEAKEVQLELVAAVVGEHKNHAAVVAARGQRADADVVTKIEGLPALLIELIDLDDPVEVGAVTSYEIRVTNTGTKTESNLQLICTVPEQMAYLNAKAPAGCKFRLEGNEIVFDPLPRLAPRADAMYRVYVKGKAAGDLRFQVRVKADGLMAPVLKEESTRVYGDGE